MKVAIAVVLLVVLTDAASAWAPAFVKLPTHNVPLSAGKSDPLLSSVRSRTRRVLHSTRPTMNFLGFDLSELKSIGNMIIQCEGAKYKKQSATH
jgi:hypothetical protein